MTRLEAYRQARIMKKMGMSVAVVERNAEYDVAYVQALDDMLADGWTLVERL